MMPALAFAFLEKYWRWFAGGMLILACVVGLQLYKHQRNEARAEAVAAQAQRDQIRARLDVSNASIGTLQGKIAEQNAAIEEVNADGERRLLEGRALILAEVRKGAASSEAARKLISAPSVGGDQSKTSDAVMALRGSL